MNFLVKTLTSGRRNQVRLHWQRHSGRSKYGCFCSSPQVTYLHTKNEGGLKFFISKFASLSRRIALNKVNDVDDEEGEDDDDDSNEVSFDLRQDLLAFFHKQAIEGFVKHCDYLIKTLDNGQKVKPVILKHLGVDDDEKLDEDVKDDSVK